MHGYFVHGPRNWGSTMIIPISDASDISSNNTIQMKSVDEIVKGRKVLLWKLDCEGCEWAALLGGVHTLSRVAMIKLELNMKTYEANNETISAINILHHLVRHNFTLMYDEWPDSKLLFGGKGEEIQDIDTIFGSSKFNIQPTYIALKAAAKKVLSSVFLPTQAHLGGKDPKDIIAIRNHLYQRMKNHFLR